MVGAYERFINVCTHAGLVGWGLNLKKDRTEAEMQYTRDGLPDREMTDSVAEHIDKHMAELAAVGRSRRSGAVRLSEGSADPAMGAIWIATWHHPTWKKHLFLASEQTMTCEISHSRVLTNLGSGSLRMLIPVLAR